MTLFALSGLVLLCPWLRAAPEGSVSPLTCATLVTKVLGISEAIRANLSAQDAAWPTRQTDQSNERPPPQAVRQLQAEQRQLELTLKQTCLLLEREAATDLEPLLTALQSADSPESVDALVKVAVQAGPEEPRTTEILIALADRASTCPGTLVDALARLQNPRASRYLLERGQREKSLALFAAAGRSGDLTVLERVVDLADASSGELSDLALKAFRNYAPPKPTGFRSVGNPGARIPEASESRDPTLRALIKATDSLPLTTEARKLIRGRIERVRSTDLRCALISYLGLFKDAGDSQFLRAVYDRRRDDVTRLAVLGALGNIQKDAGEFLMQELTASSSSETLRRGCLHALAATRYRPAAKEILKCLEEPALREDALRALGHIAGRDLGHDEATWRRWWRAQPEADAEDKDPEA